MNQYTRVTKICERCNASFTIKKYRSSTARFCSRACRKTRVTLTCERCAKSFEIKTSLLNENAGRFCSYNCYWATGRLLLVCEQCKKNFSVHKSRKGEDRPCRFCSVKCYQEYYVGPVTFSWLGGKSFEPYPAKFNNALKEMIRKRDNFKCRICQTNQDENERALSVHHIDYDKNNIDPSNLISLCDTCHTKTNFNRDAWELFFKSRQ